MNHSGSGKQGSHFADLFLDLVYNGDQNALREDEEKAERETEAVRCSGSGSTSNRSL